MLFTAVFIVDIYKTQIHSQNFTRAADDNWLTGQRVGHAYAHRNNGSDKLSDGNQIGRILFKMGWILCDIPPLF